MSKIAIMFLLLAAPCFGSEIEAPKPKPKPVVRAKFDSGKVARLHWTAAAFDYATTGNSSSQCRAWYGAERDRYCFEHDPLARPFIGYHNTPSWRLALGWAGESVLVSKIPNLKIRRITQISLIGIHLWCGAVNLKNWH